MKINLSQDIKMEDNPKPDEEVAIRLDHSESLITCIDIFFQIVG